MLLYILNTCALCEMIYSFPSSQMERRRAMSLLFTINISTSQLEDFFLLTPKIPFVWCSFEAFFQKRTRKRSVCFAHVFIQTFT